MHAAGTLPYKNVPVLWIFFTGLHANNKRPISAGRQGAEG